MIIFKKQKHIKNVKETARLICKNDVPLLLTKDEIKMIRDAYNATIKSKKNTIEDLILLYPECEELLQKSSAIKTELTKQFLTGKTLQAGVLNELNTAESIAKNIFHYNSFIPVQIGSPQKIPSYILKEIDTQKNCGFAGRYVFYDKKTEEFITSYGNPECCDMTRNIKGDVVKFEIKDRPALLAESDLTYDETGKLILPQGKNADIPLFVRKINEFNETTSIFNEFGSNISLFEANNPESSTRILKEAVQNKDFDILLTVDKNHEIVAIRKEDMTHIFSDGAPAFSLKGSEIRTTGRNYIKPFTKEYLTKTLESKGFSIDENKICHFPYFADTCIGENKRKRTASPSRFKINEAFFIPIKDIERNGLFATFPYKKIKQVKPGITIHLTLIKPKEEITKELYL